MFLLAEIPAWIRPLWVVAAGALAATALLWLIGALLSWVMPKVAAIARTTAKEAYAQPLFWVELALGTLLLITFAFIPYNTFGDDVKVMKEAGLSLILVMGALLAIWSASVSVSEEIEGRTALTILSKPITRRQLLVGKFLGVLAPVYMLFVALGVVFLAMVSFKITFDARDAVLTGDMSRHCLHEIVQISPGLLLKFFETVVLTSISVAVATRLPMVPNLVICVSIYAAGHLVPLLVQSSAAREPIVAFMGQLFATVLPVLDHFDIQAAVAAGRDVPLVYLAWTAAYCVLYSTVAMLVALVLFEDRDVA
jgi:hypothetical protein